MGSFGGYNDTVILRVWTRLRPVYFRSCESDHCAQVFNTRGQILFVHKLLIHEFLTHRNGRLHSVSKPALGDPGANSVTECGHERLLWRISLQRSCINRVRLFSFLLIRYSIVKSTGSLLNWAVSTK